MLRSVHQNKKRKIPDTATFRFHLFFLPRFFPFIIIRLDILGEKKRIFRNSETITGLKYKNGKAQSASIFSKRKYELFSKKS